MIFPQFSPHEHYLGAYGGYSLRILGTQERRSVLGFSYGSARPDRRLTLWGRPASMTYEVFATKSWAHLKSVPYRDNAVSLLAYADYPIGVFSAYYGGGIQWTNRTSKDLELAMNATPMVGVTYRGIPSLKLDVRYFHISNAGRKRPNYGQNQILFGIALRY